MCNYKIKFLLNYSLITNFRKKEKNNSTQNQQKTKQKSKAQIWIEGIDIGTLQCKIGKEKVYEMISRDSNMDTFEELNAQISNRTFKSGFVAYKKFLEEKVKAGDYKKVN